MVSYCGFSKGDKVITVLYEGLVPAARIGSGIPSALIRKHCRFAEWHNNSKHFDTSEFFDPEYVKGRFGIYGKGHKDFDCIASAELIEYYEADKAKKPSEVYKDCRVDWLEYSGLIRPRECSEHSADGCTVRVKEQTAYIKFTDGKTMTMPLATYGFSFTPNFTTYRNNIANAAKEREQYFKKYGATLANTISWKPSSSRRVLAAMAENGRTVLAMKERTDIAARANLSKEGIVVHGYYDAAADTFLISTDDIDVFPARN